MVIVYRSVKLINPIYCQFNVIIRASYCDEAEYQQLLLLLSIPDRHDYQLIVRNIQNVFSNLVSCMGATYIFNSSYLPVIKDFLKPSAGIRIK
jgi:hypothetical protein